MPTAPAATVPARQEIEERRKTALAKQRAETEEILARQDVIHKLAYQLHQEVHGDDELKEKPGFDVALKQATKIVDDFIAAAKAKIAAAEAKAKADAAAALKAQEEAEAAQDEADAKAAAAQHSEHVAAGDEDQAVHPHVDPAVESTDEHAA